ncbi:MAG: hypothetical protein LAO56_07570 [Acidobacteriia bacterium]|nr:hypothetical protein [Terriglobia bacterium]
MKLAMAMIMVLTLTAYGQQKDAPASPSEQHSEMMKRGDHAMGFSHETTTHHFRLFKDGGAIEVQANDPADKASRDEIRTHLSHIAEMFAAGNLNIPMFIHDTTPPGAPVMEKRHDLIHYKFQETEAGARVRIRTADKAALDAVHEFLRFQIAEHHTGDRTDITNDSAGN